MLRAVLPAALFMTLAAAAPLAYPPTPAGPVAETKFGVTVKDPYRWLENDVRTDPKVAQWVAAENAVTNAYLATLPGRAKIKARLTELWNYERYGVPVARGGRIFYLRNTGLQNQSVLYVEDAPGAPPRLLIDPNPWAKDGATALAEWEPSKDGKRLAYAVQDGGTDWRTVRFLDADTGKDLPDRLEWVKFSGLAWTADGQGLFYSRFAAPEAGAKYQATNLNQQVWLHRLGTPQSADTLVYATPDRPRLNHAAETTDDGRWLLITTSEGTDDRYELHLLDLTKPGAKPVTLVKGLEYSWALAGSDGTTLYMVTNKDAPRYRVVAFDAANPAAPPRPLVPEGAGTIDNAALVGGALVVSTLEDAKAVVRRYGRDGAPMGSVALPGIGSVTGFDADAASPVTYYSFSSFNAPTTIYRYDARTNASTVFKAPKTAFDPGDYVVTQTFYTSKDGTKVPMFVSHRRGHDLGTPAPTLLYGYGGFNVSLPPAFSVAALAWMEMGGVYAVANLRGGGEYGKAWHDAGRLAAKQNVFDDFIAAGEALIKAGTTSKEKLAIFGRSNGGLLVGAVVNQRPDLFAAALPAVGVMDMLRFNQFSAGRYWTDDYGDPADEAAFRTLYSYSPYHNIRQGKDYPAILVTTADTDDRVVPGHSFKYAAALQAAQIGDKPHLIRIETRAGHGSGKPTDKLIEEFADQWAFIAHWTGMPGN